MSIIYTIEGRHTLCGEIKTSGAKNAVLPILSAAILTKGIVRLQNCPDLSDVHSTLDILRALGCGVEFINNTAIINSSSLNNYNVPALLAAKCRSSLTFLGPLMAICKEAILPYPGGCVIGQRPLNLHIDGIKALGIKEIQDDGHTLHLKGQPHGSYVCLPFPSVGATENIMMASVLSHGTTYICGAAKEPEIVDLQDFLNTCGANVTGAGTSIICIEGTNAAPLLTDVEYTVMPDRIEAGTYLIAGAICGRDLTISHCIPAHFSSLIDILVKIGVVLEIGDTYISVTEGAADKYLAAPEILFANPYPGFPTDLQAPITPLLCICRGRTILADHVFPQRYAHIAQLSKMSADIRVKYYNATNAYCLINGSGRLCGADLKSDDLRSGAALILAALGADSKSTINDNDYIERGYEDIVRKLKSCGAEIFSDKNLYIVH